MNANNKTQMQSTHEEAPKILLTLCHAQEIIADKCMYAYHITYTHIHIQLYLCTHIHIFTNTLT